ncbi:MAG: hypothetical protein CVT92_16420 [Bacteroidetes bacterium HGW-Bacteroidetes-1]|nr:MAG: hypothetical protein CVT92_16420 [Bacteroidetes bacterium HGW-Bacteroidetes-1]
MSFIKQRHIHDLTQPYLGFYGLPGIALILNVVPLYSPWLTFPQQSEFMLDRVDLDILQSSIIGILLQKDGTMPPLPGQFISFPANYSKVGELNCLYVNQRLQFWIPNK